MTIELIRGDCLKVMADMEPESVDTIITDPPYGLTSKQGDKKAGGFMGMKWDSGIPGVPFWEAMLRVAKPGAMLLALGGTRTYHRLACAIEDAGWEIRDCINYLHDGTQQQRTFWESLDDGQRQAYLELHHPAQTRFWAYAQGFPKGHNWPVKLHEMTCTWYGCMVQYDHEETELNTGGNEKATESTERSIPSPEHNMRFVQASYLQTPVYACAECGQVLQPFMSKQGASEWRQAWAKSENVWPEQPSMEGQGNMEASEGELSRCEVCTLSGRPVADGAEGWVHHGTSNDNGHPPWATLETDGSCPSYRPQSLEQFNREPDALSIERQAQTSRGWNVALKPSYEPILVAMKKLDGTFAENALKHGVAGFNIDGSRVGTDEGQGGGSKCSGGYQYADKYGHDGFVPSTQGRWPANLVLDGSDSVTGLFPVTKQSGYRKNPSTQSGSGFHNNKGAGERGHNDIGSAARFFQHCPPDRVRYVPKASKCEREAGLSGYIPCHKCGGLDTETHIDKKGNEVECRRNSHATVKPISLMEWLCTLTKTPTGGVVLDPFVGSGTTLVACVNTGRDGIGIDTSEEYIDIARRRVAHAEREKQSRLM